MHARRVARGLVTSLVWLVGCGGGGASLNGAKLEGDDVTVSQVAVSSSCSVVDCVIAASQLIALAPLVPGADLDVAELQRHLFGCPKMVSATPAVMALDWGTGCTGPDGRDRHGRMQIDARDAVLADGPIRLSIESYGASGWSLTGDAVLHVAGGATSFELAQGTLTSDRVYHVSASFSVSIDAQDSAHPSLVSGTGSVDGVAFSIEQALKVPSDCAHPTGGTVSVELAPDRSALADFGAGGACDDLFTLTIGSDWQEVHLD